MTLTLFIILSVTLLVMYLQGTPLTIEGFSDFVEHGIAITNPPPELSEKKIHWDSNFAKQSRVAHQVRHADKLINYFPMAKPPVQYERVNDGNEIDIARSQFIPKMAKRQNDN